MSDKTGDSEDPRASADEPAAPGEMREIPFRVDMAGIIEILGCSLYSRRDVALRELLQNAHDAIMRRRAEEPHFLGEIRLRRHPEGPALEILDDGIGLTEDEAERFLGTLGSGISGLMKRARDGNDGAGVIGQFGVGLFSAFLIADRIIVESRRSADDPAVRWEAGSGTSILIGPGSREEPGTTVRLELQEDAALWAREPGLIETAVRHYADFLPVPIHLDDARRRLNVLTPSWFEATPDEEMVSLELEQRFDDTPLDIILLRREDPTIRGALFITRERTPGFSGRPLVTATVRRMVISHRLDGLFPAWGSFYRGVLDLPDLQPTTSREDLVRDEAFEQVREEIEQALLRRLHELADSDPVKLRSIITWHRYTFAGAALEEPRLLELLHDHYLFSTSQGPLSFADVLERSRRETFGEEDQATIWYNLDRLQEAWTNRLFEGGEQPVVQALRTFEAALIGQLARVEAETRISVKIAHADNDEFVREVLGVSGFADRTLEPAWQEFLGALPVEVLCEAFDSPLPVLAFPDRGAELKRDFDSLRREGRIPAAFSRMIDRHLPTGDGQTRVLLNTRHRVVKQALAGSVHSPLASVLRLLVHEALMRVGAVSGESEQAVMSQDLDWIAETLRPPRERPDRDDSKASEEDR